MGRSFDFFLKEAAFAVFPLILSHWELEEATEQNASAGRGAGGADSLQNTG